MLPIVPILPKGLALLGDDPYGCQLQLNPKYRPGDETEKQAQDLVEEDALPADDEQDAESRPEVNSDVELRMPLPQRYLPTIPLQF